MWDVQRGSARQTPDTDGVFFRIYEKRCKINDENTQENFFAESFCLKVYLKVFANGFFF